MLKDTTLFNNDFKPNIALLELYAIVLAFNVWAKKLQGKFIVLRSDRQATCFFINKMKADISAAMDLLRYLTKKCLHFQIYFTCRHFKGRTNFNCKALSRGDRYGDIDILQEKPDSQLGEDSITFNTLATTMDTTDDKVPQSVQRGDFPSGGDGRHSTDDQETVSEKLPSVPSPASTTGSDGQIPHLGENDKADSSDNNAFLEGRQQFCTVITVNGIAAHLF